MFGKIALKIRALVETPVSASYADETLTRFRIAREALGGEPNAEHLALLLSLRPATVTDFGGAAGEMARALAAHGIQVTVVENPTMVRLARRSAGVEFSTDIPAECDVFFSSGTIQYTPDPLAVLSKGFTSARMAVVLVRNAFSDQPAQHMQSSWLYDNGSGPIPPGFKNVRISYTTRTTRESDIGAPGFRLQSAGDPKPEFGGYGRDLVFVRDGSPASSG